MDLEIFLLLKHWKQKRLSTYYIHYILSLPNPSKVFRFSCLKKLFSVVCVKDSSATIRQLFWQRKYEKILQWPSDIGLNCFLLNNSLFTRRKKLFHFNFESSIQPFFLGLILRLLNWIWLFLWVTDILTLLFFIVFYTFFLGKLFKFRSYFEKLSLFLSLLVLYCWFNLEIWIIQQMFLLFWRLDFSFLFGKTNYFDWKILLLMFHWIYFNEMTFTIILELILYPILVTMLLKIWPLNKKYFVKV